ncbi:MAG TPA: branched-chain amino acid ABC transporter permease [Hyphomicrobiaceae bacterium]|nr:branched-chain amino acid ABC transporter permease [Hyphomicrobiaceae bacterium]
MVLLVAGEGGRQGGLLAILSLLVALLTGCAAGIDAGQARLCRAIIPALNGEAAAIEIVRTAPLAGAPGVRVDYRVRAPAGQKSRFLECRFAGTREAGSERAGLAGVATEAGPLSDLRLYVLKRFWLGPDAAAADPEPISNAAEAPALPRGLAIGLQHAIFALPPIAIYALLAAAYSLIYGLVGRINLAFGELAAVAGYAALLGFAICGALPGQVPALLLAVVLALSAATMHGLVVGRLLFAPLSRAAGQQVLIGSIALAIVLQEYLRLSQGAKLIWVHPIFNTPYAVARSGDFVVTFTPVALAAACLCLLAALGLVGLIKMSRFGRAWRACADDPAAAALFGIDHRLLLLKTFALASVLAGLAGYVVTVYYGAFGYAGGIVLGLKSLLAAVAGGIGRVGGAFLGGVLIGALEQAWSAIFPIEFRDLAIFVLLIVLLVLRPSGLFGWGETLPQKPTPGAR